MSAVVQCGGRIVQPIVSRNTAVRTIFPVVSVAVTRRRFSSMTGSG